MVCRYYLTCLTAAVEVVKVAVASGAAASSGLQSRNVDHGFSQGNDVPEIEINF